MAISFNDPELEQKKKSFADAAFGIGQQVGGSGAVKPEDISAKSQELGLGSINPNAFKQKAIQDRVKEKLGEYATREEGIDALFAEAKQKKGLTTSEKVALGTLALLPTIIGAAWGGNRGGAIGAAAGTTGALGLLGDIGKEREAIRDVAKEQAKGKASELAKSRGDVDVSGFKKELDIISPKESEAGMGSRLQLELPNGKIVYAYKDGDTVKDLNGVPIPADVLSRSTVGFAPRSMNDAFGNPSLISGGSGTFRQLQSSKREPVSSLPESQLKQFQPDKDQRKVLDSEKTRLDKVLQKSNEQVSAVNRLKALLKDPTKYELSIIRTQMPRVSSEVGNLNETEQKAWEGSQAILDQAAQYLSTISGSKLTEDNARELEKTLDLFGNQASENINSIIDGSASNLEQIHSIPSNYVRQTIGVSAAPIAHKNEQQVQVKEQLKTNLMQMTPDELMKRRMELERKNAGK